MSGRGSYRIALRDDDLGLDDVVVKGVSMFRMERMSDTNAWLCCYLGDGSDHDRITFWITGRDLRYGVTEYPHGDVAYEDGSSAPVRAPLEDS